MTLNRARFPENCSSSTLDAVLTIDALAINNTRSNVTSTPGCGAQQRFMLWIRIRISAPQDRRADPVENHGDLGQTNRTPRTEQGNERFPIHYQREPGHCDMDHPVPRTGFKSCEPIADQRSSGNRTRAGVGHPRLGRRPPGGPGEL
jgi:hypothetical protein